jgi:thiol-disulfide isomerase/thioredoxin
MVVLSTKLKTRAELEDILKNNPGIIVIKLGAEWCGPCKRIEPIVEKFFNNSPGNCLCISIDIDESIDIFAMYKRFRVLNGIPGLVCYTIEDDSIYPNFICNTANPVQVEKFFNDCTAALNN